MLPAAQRLFRSATAAPSAAIWLTPQLQPGSQQVLLLSIGQPRHECHQTAYQGSAGTHAAVDGQPAEPQPSRRTLASFAAPSTLHAYPEADAAGPSFQSHLAGDLHAASTPDYVQQGWATAEHHREQQQQQQQQAWSSQPLPQPPPPFQPQGQLQGQQPPGVQQLQDHTATALLPLNTPQHQHHHQHHHHDQQQQQQQQNQHPRHHHHHTASRRSHRPPAGPPPDPLRPLTDLTTPASWYPLARSLGPRRLVAHLGPTNSGKTHAALSALKGAASGVYAGPLRLLAAEVADRLNAAGVPCDLVTGQEVVRVKGARHVACTVEMAPLEGRVEVAVLDEVQMVGDTARGWAWTRALLGLPARELHVAGEPATLPLLEQLTADCADELQVNTYRRLTPLVVEEAPVGGVRGIRSGDCVVAFSRQWLHKLRRRISAARGTHACGMVYGALPPEARRSQAGLFNSPGSGVDVLVASDAIGMGLNLNIRRVVFATMHKFDGEVRRPLTPSEVKQIAGRAGRYASDHDQGYVAVMEAGDLGVLQAALVTPSPDILAASLLPRFDQLSRWASQTGAHSFAEALTSFAGAARVSPPYVLADLGNMVSIARLLRHLEGGGGLTQEDLYTWCISPAGVEDKGVAQALLAFASNYSQYQHVPLEAAPQHQLLAVPTTDAELAALEELFRVYDLYVWLAGRFPGCFPDRKLALRRRAQAAQLVNEGLNAMGHAAAASSRSRSSSYGREGGREEGWEGGEWVWRQAEAARDQAADEVALAELVAAAQQAGPGAHPHHLEHKHRRHMKQHQQQGPSKLWLAGWSSEWGEQDSSSRARSSSRPRQRGSGRRRRSKSGGGGRGWEEDQLACLLMGA